MSLQSKFGLNRLDESTHNVHINNSLMSQTRNNVFVTPTRSTFRRYALAETPSTPSPSRQQKKTNQNIYLSTKIDSRSPGFSSRVVQYNEEQEKSLPTHQAKYDKLGVFPIVHFFKKDLPFLKRKAGDFNTSPVTSPDLSKYNTPEQNRILLEKIIKTSPQTQSILSPKIEPNTKSVLDALKEISRKRIHADGEDFIQKDEGKRLLDEYDNENLSRKRIKQNTSGDDFTAISSSSKYSSINELMASHSSMDGYFPQQTKSDKVTTDSTSFKKPAVKSKPVLTPTKYVNVETQTISPPLTTPVQTVTEVEKPSKEEIIVKPIEPVTKPKRPSPVKVFDELPLEAMRRNRLTVLMGTANPIKSKDPNDLHRSGDKLLHKPLISILSGGSKTPQKSNKHVTFDIPNSTVTNPISTSSESIIPVASNFSIDTPSVTKTSSSVISPIVSASIVESKVTQKSSLEVSKESPVVISSNNDSLFTPPSTTSLQFNTSLPSSLVLNFNNPASTTQATAFTSSITAVTTKPDEKPTVTTVGNGEGGSSNFMFNTSFNKPVIPKTLSNNLSQQPQAGFKFDLKETTSVGPSISSPSFTFMASTTSAKTTTTSSSLMFTSNTMSSTPAKPTFSFGAPNSSSQPTSTGTLNNSANTKPFTLSSNGTFPLNKSPSGNLASNSSTSVFTGAAVSVSSSNIFTQSNATPQTTNSIISSFGGNSATPSFVVTCVNSSKPMFNFGASNNLTTTVALTFGTSIGSLGEGTKPFSLGTTTTAASSAPISFGTPVNTTTTTSSFNTPNNNFAPNSSAFSATTTKTSTSGGGSLFFGATNTSFHKTSGFNENNNASTFRNQTASKSMFGQNSAPAFNTTTSPFSATTSASSFGSTTVTLTFNTTTAAPSFGTKTNSTFGTSAPSFGVTTAPTFGSGTTTTTAAAPSFGATATPSFGTTAPNFGNNNQSSGTSAFANVGTASNNIFGSSGGFGSSGTIGVVPGFGSSTGCNFTTSNFGSNEKSGFSTNVNAENKNNFVPNFGSSSFNSGFGTTTTASGFGSNTNTFTAPSGSFNPNGGAFGQATNTPSFGASSLFDKSAAAASNSDPNPFGGNNSSFGSSGFSASNSQPNQNAIFAFGSNTSNKPPVFSFGASEPSKPTFNFQAPNTNTPNMFTSPNPPSFGPVPSPQFNGPPPSGNMFNIGTGGSSNTTRSRQLHKAKRR